MSQASVPEGSAKPIARRNRRVSIRYRCAPATVGKVLSTDDHEYQRAWILDLSLHGIGMELPRPIEAGRLIIVSLRSSDGMTVHELSAKVMHCDLSLQGAWYVGCELTTPLSRDQLDQLL